MRQLEGSLSQINLEHCELVKQVVKARLEREELEDELVKCTSTLLVQWRGRAIDGFVRMIDKIAFANAEFKAASDRASMSPLSLRRQSELSIASATSNSSSSGGGYGNGYNGETRMQGERGNSYSSGMSSRSGSMGY